MCLGRCRRDPDGRRHFDCPSAPTKSSRLRGALRQSLSEFDRQLGLGGSGPLVSAAREVAMSEWVTGEATFEILVDRSGMIQSARIVDASRDAAGWRRFGEELKSSSPRPGMRLPERARGVWTLLYVNVDNELTERTSAVVGAGCRADLRHRRRACAKSAYGPTPCAR